LIDAFDQLLHEAGPICAQRRGDDRLRSHLLSGLVCLGQHTLTGLLCTAGRPFHDWTADYRLYAGDRVEAQPLFEAVRRGIEAQLPPHQPLVIALDDSLLRKRGHKIPGTAWRRDPLGAPFGVSFVWAQRVLQMSAVLPEGSEGAARTLPIDFVQAPSAPRPRKTAPPEQWAAYQQQQRQLNLNMQAAERLKQLQIRRQQQGPVQPPWVVIDGRFTNATFLKQSPTDVVLIGRVRGDACFHEAIEPRATAGGRPRYYGPRLPTPEQLRQDDTVPWQSVSAFAAGQRHDFRIKTLDQVRWRCTGARRALRVIVIAPLGYRLHQAGRILYRKPAYLVCTDPSLPLEKVLQAYLWRWGIEVNFRDQKTLLGVGQARVRNPRAVELVPAVAVAAYAMLLLAASRLHTPLGLPTPKWRPVTSSAHATTSTLINHLRHELWADALRPGLCALMHPPTLYPKSHKPIPQLETAVLYALAG
jgi:hypothetical protein